VIARSFPFHLPRVALVGTSVCMLTALALVAEAADSVYTSIRPADCRAVRPELQREFAAKDLGVQECPAPADWRLLFVASDANSWLEVRRDDFRWSAEDPVVYDQPIGLFPNVGGASVVEWRQDDQAQPHALIFRVAAQDPDDPADRVSRLFVVRIEENTACLIGRVTTNEAARALADGSATCPGPR
jgi:hypothetical protein